MEEPPQKKARADKAFDKVTSEVSKDKPYPDKALDAVESSKTQNTAKSEADTNNVCEPTEKIAVCEPTEKMAADMAAATENGLLVEKDVGITEYIGSHDEMTGVIKQRYSTFYIAI